MVAEAELFVDRAIVLFLIRQLLRKGQASSWADVGVYYANYFAAASASRLGLSSVTHVSTDVYEVRPIAASYFEFHVKKANGAASHKKSWDLYYSTITDMGWPDSATVAVLAPPFPPNRHRERLLRESINYTPGKGFLEIHDSAAKFKIRAGHLLTFSLAAQPIDDSTFLDQRAFQPIEHVLRLLFEIQSRYLQPAEVESRKKTRTRLSRYAQNAREAKLLTSCLG